MKDRIKLTLAFAMFLIAWAFILAWALGPERFER